MRICVVWEDPICLQELGDTVRSAAPAAEVCCIASATDALASSDLWAVDVAFVGLGRTADGADSGAVSFARKLCARNPRANIVFVVSSPTLAAEVVGIRASGLVVAPLTEAMVQEELGNLRCPVAEELPHKPRLRVQCFGNFEAYVDNQPLKLRSEHAKELLAYLVDRKGAKCTVREIASVLWEDKPHSDSQQAQLRRLANGLKRCLKAAGCEDVVMHSYGVLWILTQNIDCDYYDYLLQRPSVRAKFRGEYMSQYSWAERTLANLLTYE